MAKKEKIPTAKELEANLLNDYKRWKEIYENGCSDPSWSDGTNINLVRTHILIGKKRCEEVLKDNFVAYPDCYFFPTPYKMPNDFMAVDRKFGGVVHLATKIVPYCAAVKFNFEEELE